MAKVNDVVQAAVKEISDKVKEIKQSDDDDLKSLSGSFFDVSKIADTAGETLEKADQALGGAGDDDDDEAEQGEGDEGEVIAEAEAEK